MGRFLTALAIFLVAHIIPALPALRGRLQKALGGRGYLAAYFLLSLALFAGLIREALIAPYVPLWFAGPWSYWFALLLMPLSLVLLGAAALTPNPLSVAFVSGDYDPAIPGAVAITRHPILWGLALWGVAHLPVNGHLVGLILFGGLASFAFLGLALIEQRRRATLGEARWSTLAAPTSVLPFGALLSGRAQWPHDALTLGGAVLGLCFAAFLLGGGHFWLFGRNPLAIF